jgi:hypothetical protein
VSQAGTTRTRAHRIAARRALPLACADARPARGTAPTRPGPGGPPLANGQPPAWGRTRPGPGVRPGESFRTALVVAAPPANSRRPPADAPRTSGGAARGLMGGDAAPARTGEGAAPARTAEDAAPAPTGEDAAPAPTGEGVLTGGDGAPDLTEGHAVLDLTGGHAAPDRTGQHDDSDRRPPLRR